MHAVGSRFLGGHHGLRAPRFLVDTGFARTNCPQFSLIPFRCCASAAPEAVHVRHSRLLCARTSKRYEESSAQAAPLAVICDMDGTLLSSKKSVSRRNLDAIRAARASGVLFIPASGRSRPGIHNVLGALGEELLADGCPSVALNGLAVYGPGGRGRGVGDGIGVGGTGGIGGGDTGGISGGSVLARPVGALKMLPFLPDGSTPVLAALVGAGRFSNGGGGAAAAAATAEAMAAAAEAVAMATGAAVAAGAPATAPAAATAVTAAVNRSLGLDFGPLLYQALLEPDVVAAVVRLWRVHPMAAAAGVSLLGSSGERVVCERMDKRLAAYANWREPPPEEVGPLDEAALMGLPLHRLFFMADHSREVEVLKDPLLALLGQRASLTRGIPQMIEVLPPGASKGRGVMELLAALGIPRSQVVAVGDEINDIEMLQLVGCGVAMGQALDEVKAVASWVAPTNDEDGVAAVIETFCNV